MCSMIVASSIVEVLEQKISDGEVFTAFEITKAVRAAVTDNVRHSEVRGVVNSEFLQGDMKDYSRDLCTLNTTGNPQAFVYYPELSKEASDHPLVDSSTVSDPDDDDDGDGTDDSLSDPDIVSMTAEGRINIPKEKLDKISPTGGSYDFMISGQLECRKANSDGRIRFTMSDIGIGTKCRIKVDSATISISLYSF